MTERSTPPAHDVDPDDLDEDTHPTAAWSVGERLEPGTAAALKTMIDDERA